MGANADRSRSTGFESLAAGTGPGKQRCSDPLSKSEVALRTFGWSLTADGHGFLQQYPRFLPGTAVGKP
ncbi:hypothetical protein Rhe02_07910 [Rhizocola hellebori]|uniref:Uncharacterized protein n=1 Tax=Rhizocola hellebori TaxID=1392758 RepID=A0A8J3VCN1_9ACTN|nr:hypothetical protein [Rhizocola hellebori]GIH02724.1 hypothetical protein Rhe02_07910 [Rhizocola hellebori]